MSGLGRSRGADVATGGFVAGGGGRWLIPTDGFVIGGGACEGRGAGCTPGETAVAGGGMEALAPVFLAASFFSRDGRGIGARFGL